MEGTVYVPQHMHALFHLLHNACGILECTNLEVFPYSHMCIRVDICVYVLEFLIQISAPLQLRQSLKKTEKELRDSYSRGVWQTALQET